LEEEDASVQDEDNQGYEGKNHRQPSLRVEMQMVHFKSKPCDNEEKELNELVRQLYSCSVRDMEYATLYVHCLCHFSDVTQEIPKPEQWLSAAPATFTYQAAAAPTPPAQQH
jgi:plasmid rolling circle replication initiator protein Rep